MAKNGNRALGEAKKQKKDEFYTQLADINAELRHYAHHFAGKVVFCNCDDPYESNFFKYFAANFNALRLKRLVATCYAGSPVAGRQLELDLFGDDAAGTAALHNGHDSMESRHLGGDRPRIPHKIVINEVTDANGDGRIDLAGKELTEQELLNAVYAGPWTADMKRFFSKSSGPAYTLANRYLKDEPIRQDYMETALEWISQGAVKQ